MNKQTQAAASTETNETAKEFTSAGQTAKDFRDSGPAAAGKVDVEADPFVNIPEGKVLISKKLKDGVTQHQYAPESFIESRWNSPFFRIGMVALGTVIGGGAGFYGGKKYGEKKGEKKAEQMLADARSKADAEMASMTPDAA